ncbi:GntR family transcriptional regulator [Alkalihalobacterium elongatum]|uniref:GntR family transcriptional regulator n=1 Tax=Alkalihalobacterium elongatum TaxID=2675466 RepID=UPI001C1FFBEA|nr:GntR family transcriptional regulator [Alkalihalobacterium elongatum]
MIKADSRPLYLQVIDKIKEDIDQQIFKEGEKLPSEFELSKQLGVSRATLREALRILEDEGVVLRRHGVGTFVHSKPLFSSGIEELYSVSDMIANANKEPGTIFLSSFVEEATEDDKVRFDEETMENCVVIERVRTADDEPVVYCLDRIPEEMLGKHSIHEIGSIFKFLESIGHNISYAVTTIVPVGYHDKISPILNCEPETSLLLLKQMHYDESDQPILFSLNYFRADKFKFKVVRKRIKA